jgi:hypothetical protein
MVPGFDEIPYYAHDGGGAVVFLHSLRLSNPSLSRDQHPSWLENYVVLVMEVN